VISIKKGQILASAVVFSLLASPAFAAETDSDITKKVESDISKNEVTSHSKIDVTTKDGVVFLKGDVKTEREANKAIETASSVSGVTDVDYDKLQVNSQGSHPYEDAYITAKVKGAFVREKLFGDSPIDVMGIKVETKDGVVTLSGEADKESQINTAVSLAKSIKGVSNVMSNVEVKPKMSQ